MLEQTDGYNRQTNRPLVKLSILIKVVKKNLQMVSGPINYRHVYHMCVDKGALSVSVSSVNSGVRWSLVREGWRTQDHGDM